MTEIDTSLYQIAYQADFYSRYPGETVKFNIRFSPKKAIEGPVILEINIPDTLKPIIDESSGASKDYGPPWLRIEPDIPVWKPGAIAASQETYQVLFWQFDGADIQPNQHYDYQVQAKVVKPVDDFLKSWVTIKETSDNGESERILSTSEAITIEVRSKSRLLRYLPGIYHTSDHQLMWRYLMIFESFWRLFEDRLANLPNYFDTHMAPPDFQPWLASWIGMTWDKRIPEETRQKLRLEMMWLYQKRGTRVGLQRYLQIYLRVPDDNVERQIKIVENPVGNFILGEEIELGETLIMGSPDEVVCKFEVTIDINLLTASVNEAVIKDLIDSWKPAHTSYDLFFLNLKDQK